jgi:DNA transformation protein
VFFGIIGDNELYFKVDAVNRRQYETLGSHPFVYEAKGKERSMSYWLVPPSVLEDAEKLADWVSASCDAFLRSKKGK